MDEALLAQHVDALYGTPREDFVTERDRRAKQLRADGLREEATALGRRRKPTLAAWAVDQAVHREAELVDDLLDAAGTLREAQDCATSGGGADDMRRATHEVHRLVDALADVGDAVLDEAGAGAGHREDVRQTILAAALDPTLHDDLRRGVLERAAEHVGFGGMMAAGTDDDEDAARAARTRTRRRELTQQRDALRRSLDEERTRTERAGARAEELRQRAAGAAQEAQEARATMDRVVDELRTVESALDDLGRT